MGQDQGEAAQTISSELSESSSDFQDMNKLALDMSSHAMSDTGHDVNDKSQDQSETVLQESDQNVTQLLEATNSEESISSTRNDENEVNMSNLFGNVHSLRKNYLNNIIIGHLNINSLSTKICEIKELQSVCKFDVLVLSETKLDGSFKQEPLNIEGYSCVRQDKRSNSGGLLVYISRDIPYSVGSVSICNNEIECISVELHISDDKILLLAMYKNPRTDPVVFKRFFQETCEFISDSFENIVIIGDLNFNMLQKNMLSTIMPTYSLTNVIKDVTCFKSNQPTLIDVMLVTKRRKIIKSFSEKVGISDFHNLIGGILRLHKPAPKIKKVTTRKLSKIDYDKVLSEISETDLIQMMVHATDPNNAYDSLEQYLYQILDKHAPKRVRIIKKEEFHCMSKELRKAMLYRNQLRNKYYKFRTSHYLSLYRVQRNKVNAIKRKEIGRYFEEKCKTGTRNKDFWKAVKPLFSKSRTKSDSIPICENGELITDDHKVCGIFNNFFRKIGSEIGFPENNNKPMNDIIEEYAHHASVKMIAESINRNITHQNFMFKFVSEYEVRKTIKTLSTNKAAGYDEIPAQFIKKIAIKLVKPLTMLINQSIRTNRFPDRMKRANITPLFKKKDKLNKDNYRSVNLLPILSKIFERILYDQIYEFISPMFHRYLSGFRKGYNCQDVLIRLTEDWREQLDKGLTIGVIAIDLSKAFDCMPHGLLLAKLSAYGFDTDSCELMKSYVVQRKQRVKIGDTFSEWVHNIKGVPQGSILGPLLFNIFINDLLFFNFNSKIYNYADDNTLSCSENDITVLEKHLISDCQQAMKWFELNSMKANASKFQLMYLSRNAENLTGHDILKLGDVEIKASHSINILGVEIDKDLKFNLHIDEVCSQSGKQINALKRMKHYLDKECKMTIYNSYINNNFNYCSVIWMFTNKCNFDKLEKTNKRALRFATNKESLSYEAICAEEKQLSVYRKCVKTAASMMYKARKGTAPAYVCELFTLQESEYDMRDNDKVILPRYNTVSYGKNSMKYFGAKLWNIIPASIKSSPSLSTFKSAIGKWLLTCEESNII